MPQRLDATKAQLDNLYQQQAAAKEEVGKPFSYEDDLRVKSARLVELDTLLNLDGQGPLSAGVRDRQERTALGAGQLEASSAAPQPRKETETA